MMKNVNIYFIYIRFLSLYSDVYNDYYKMLLILYENILSQLSLVSVEIKYCHNYCFKILYLKRYERI